jgi:hypothetical protein
VAFNIFSCGDDVWKTIQSISVVPLDHSSIYLRSGVCVWITILIGWSFKRSPNMKLNIDMIRNFFTIEQFMIITFDLSTETYCQLLLPRGFDKLPLIEPTLSELMESLCFSHDFNGTDFIIWQMKEFRSSRFLDSVP